MNATNLSRTTTLAATALIAGVLGFTLTACGEQQQAPTAGSGVATPPADRSVPVVGGPSKAPASSRSTSSTAADASECGRVGGPDGALHVRIAGGDVSCETAMSIAKEYSPLIATGKSQTVSGWDCGPSTAAGELARCSRDDQAVAFTVQ
ncbi:hypothetical protein ACFQNE_13435 [Gordonia phosphorivorans]|uniref:Secreted protein n=1 Tax=Gordonia phosphorivorans TaxID=1056982 RepID=A0ABV6H3K0_9ACTN